jgi:hypothetical protein
MNDPRSPRGVYIVGRGVGGRCRPLGETLGRLAWLALAGLAYGASPFSLFPLLFIY